MSRIADRPNAEGVRGTQLANVFLLLVILSCASVFLYFFYYYGITHQRRFTNPIGPLFYYFVPILVGGALSTAFLLKPSRRTNLVLGIFLVAISIYFANLVVAFDPLVPGVHADTRGQLEFTKALRKENKNGRIVPMAWPTGLFVEQPDGSIKPQISLDGLQTWPLSGISNAVTVFCNESGQYSIYNSDEHGFNNPTGLWNGEPIDLAVVGDSIAQGSCVPTDKNFVALTRRHYPATLNVGISGEGPLLELAALEEYVTVIKPKVTLWCYSEETDLSDLLREQKSPFLKSYLKDGFTQHLFERQAEMDQALSAVVAAKETAMPTFALRAKSFLVGSFTLRDLRMRLGLVFGDSAQDLTAMDSQQQLDLFQSVLARAKAVTGSWGGVLYFVYLPATDRYISNASHDRDAILDLVRNQGLTLIDVEHTFESQKDPLSLYQELPRHLFSHREFGHYNEKGYEVVAEQILDHLQAEPKMRSSLRAISALQDSKAVVRVTRESRPHE
jgi:hypothetical protein